MRRRWTGGGKAQVQTPKQIVGFYRDEHGNTRPITKSLADRALKIVRGAQQFKGIGPAPKPPKVEKVLETVDKPYSREEVKHLLSPKELLIAGQQEFLMMSPSERQKYMEWVSKIVKGWLGAYAPGMGDINNLLASREWQVLTPQGFSVFTKPFNQQKKLTVQLPPLRQVKDAADLENITKRAAIGGGKVKACPKCGKRLQTKRSDTGTVRYYCPKHGLVRTDKRHPWTAQSKKRVFPRGVEAELKSYVAKHEQELRKRYARLSQGSKRARTASEAEFVMEMSGRHGFNKSKWPRNYDNLTLHEKIVLLEGNPD